jgi:hypothetical protein
MKGSGPHSPDAPRPSLDMGLTGFMVHGSRFILDVAVHHDERNSDPTGI